MVNKIILASKSKVRKKILEENGIICAVEPANIDEDLVKESLLNEGASPSIISKNLAELKANKTKIDDQKIADILTVNGVRFSLEDGSWGLIRASSNKPSLVVVTESPTSDKRKKKIFEFIDRMLQKTGKVGDYDQKI